MLKPEGELVTQTIAMPCNTNANGDIFGGWLVSQMDLGGALLAEWSAQCRVVTVAIDQLHFIRPVKVGETVCCYGHVLQTGRTSIRLRVQAWVRGREDNYHLAAQGEMTFVAIDAEGKPLVRLWKKRTTVPPVGA